MKEAETSDNFRLFPLLCSSTWMFLKTACVGLDVLFLWEEKLT